MCLTVPVAITPFADIVLLSFNSATAIIIQVLFALIFLNEVFICKYDLPALILIIFGSSLIILAANFAMVDYTVAILKTHLCSVKSIAFFTFTVCLLYTTIYIVKT